MAHVLKGFEYDLPVQENPSPEYPGRHIHVELPGVLVQVATALHPPLFTVHSSISASSQVKRVRNNCTEVGHVQ